MSLIQADAALSRLADAVDVKPAAMMMIRLFGSGKSTFVAQLRRRCDVTVLSMDAFRELACAELGIAYADSMVEPRNARWESRNRALHSVLTQFLATLAEQAVAARRSLVWDHRPTNPAQRDQGNEENLRTA